MRLRMTRPIPGAREMQRDAATIPVPPLEAVPLCAIDLLRVCLVETTRQQTVPFKALFPFLQQCYATNGGRVYLLASAQRESL